MKAEDNLENKPEIPGNAVVEHERPSMRPDFLSAKVTIPHNLENDALILISLDNGRDVG